MAVSKIEFDQWVLRGKKLGATHLISVCDTFDYEDYPIFVMPEDNLDDIIKKYNSKSMQRVNEFVKLDL